VCNGAQTIFFFNSIQLECGNGHTEVDDRIACRISSKLLMMRAFQKRVICFLKAIKINLFQFSEQNERKVQHQFFVFVLSRKKKKKINNNNMQFIYFFFSNSSPLINESLIHQSRCYFCVLYQFLQSSLAHSLCVARKQSKHFVKHTIFKKTKLVQTFEKVFHINSKQQQNGISNFRSGYQ
jgi:hypothetical protein